MYAALALEWIGHDLDRDLVSAHAFGLGQARTRRPWVAEIVDYDPATQRILERRFLRGRLDYRRANGTGSRGVYLHFLLPANRFYEVKQPVSWRKDVRWLCRTTDDGEVVEITLDDLPDVDTWLSMQRATADVRIPRAGVVAHA